MSEKFDGIRAYWDGDRLFSKQGNEISCPPGFTSDFPNIPLDGELWLGHNSFAQMNGIIRSRDEASWKNVKYMVFDLPSSQQPFESRMEELKMIPLPEHVRVVENEKCNGVDHLEDYVASVVKRGGEGVMVVEPNSLYKQGRTKSLLKVKVGLFLTLNLGRNSTSLKLSCWS